jgi:hypothetical protein
MTNGACASGAQVEPPTEAGAHSPTRFVVEQWRGVSDDQQRASGAQIEPRPKPECTRRCASPSSGAVV